MKTTALIISILACLLAFWAIVSDSSLAYFLCILAIAGSLVCIIYLDPDYGGQCAGQEVCDGD